MVFRRLLGRVGQLLLSSAVLHTGGKASSSVSHLISLYVRAFTHGGDVRWLTDSPSPYTPLEIGSSSITVRGETLDENGYRYLFLPDNSSFDVTPSTPYYAYLYYIIPGKHELVSQCVASTPSDRARTTIGVGEEVDLMFEPATASNPIWTTSAGSVQYSYASFTRLTAPSNAIPTTVTAILPGNTTVTKDFSVLAPTGVDHASIIETRQFGVGLSAAYMKVNVVFAHTTVSFYRVQIKEVGGPATNAYGYWETNAPPDHEDGTWLSVNEDNSWALGDECQGSARDPYGNGGGFTWDIPVKWRVGSEDQPHDLPGGWSQVSTLRPDGTFRIDKFRVYVERTINDVVTTGATQ